MPELSSAVVSAQLELHRRRANLPSKRVSADPKPSQIQRDNPLTAVSQLPSHLGWGTNRLTKQLRSNLTPITFTESTPTAPKIIPAPLSPQTIPTKVKHYPTLGIQAIQLKQVPHYQVWLSCRLLDESGKGWLDMRALRHRLTEASSPYRLFGWRRLRQVLHQGNGRFWVWNTHQGRLWFYGATKVGQNLQCSKLAGAPVYLPLAALTQGIGYFKAHLYTAWHSGRQSSNPISRQTLRELTAVPERTQRCYEKQTKVKITPNLAIGAAYTPENIEQQSWQRGGAVFKFLDKNGRFGKKDATYLAWQLPNSYVGPHEQAAHGQQRQINHNLTDLVHKGAQGNGEIKIERTYFDHGKDASKALKFSQTTYWPEGKSQKHGLWHMLTIAN
ncbi:MAG: hypothetical protein AAF490_21500 [Chloroflexota bacterium]